MAENKGLSEAWDNEDEDIEEDAETVYTGNDSNLIQGYGVKTVKITMAKRITMPKKKVEWIELDFVDKDGKTLRERFTVRGKDGKTFYMAGKNVKKQHFGVSRIKSLIKVLGLYKDETNLMKALYSNTEEADVTYEEYGKEKTEEFVVFTDLIDKKVKICVTSKKENTQMALDQDDTADQKYVNQCVKDTEAYKKANPKKKTLKKFKADDEYVNVYRWFTITTISHFCSMKGLFGSEVDDGEGILLDKFLGANDEDEIFEGRTLIAEDLSDKQLAKLNINEYGKQIDPDEDDEGYDEEEDDDYEDEEDEVEEPKKSTKKSEPKEEEDSDDDW